MNDDPSRTRAAKALNIPKCKVAAAALGGLALLIGFVTCERRRPAGSCAHSPPAKNEPGRTTAANELDIPEGVVAGIAMGALTLLILFLAFELTRDPGDHPPDLGRLGLSGIVSLIIGTLANPQGRGQRWWWYGLLGATFAGAVASAVLTGVSGHPAAAPALSVYAAAFFGLLVDGEKLSVGSPGK